MCVCAYKIDNVTLSFYLIAFVCSLLNLCECMIALTNSTQLAIVVGMDVCESLST